MKTLLSIIIVNFNTFELTAKCIKSVYKAKRNFGIEIIVIDNDSSDGSKIGLKKYLNSINTNIDNKNGFTTEFIQNASNVGFAKAVNAGIRLSKGDYVFLLNSDCILEVDALQTLLDFVAKENNIGAVGSQLLNPDGTVQPSVFKLPTLYRTIKQYWFNKKGLLDKYYPVGDRPTKVEAVVGGAMLLPKSVLDKVGLFDERYFMYFEDLDLCRRIRANNFDIYYLPQSKITHFHGSSGKGLADEANQWKRLIPSSKIYHGRVAYYLIYFSTWLSQKLKFH